MDKTLSIGTVKRHNTETDQTNILMERDAADGSLEINVGDDSRLGPFNGLVEAGRINGQTFYGVSAADSGGDIGFPEEFTKETPYPKFETEAEAVRAIVAALRAQILFEQEKLSWGLAELDAILAALPAAEGAQAAR